MNRITKAFEEAAAAGRKGFIPYFTAGYPDEARFMDILDQAADAGCTAIEIGIPFSDPMADGPIIQASSEKALRAGVNMAGIFEMIRKFRAKYDTPIVLMGYVNPILHYGYGKFVEDASAAGADGVIIPDLPPEEAGELIDAARAKDFATIFLAATTSTDERMKLIAEASKGYIYYVSRLGVTGVAQAPSETLGAMIGRLRKHTTLPIAAGFGISKPDHVRNTVAHADAAIVGSALVKLIAEHEGDADLATRVGEFCREMLGAC
ncbi:MAG: tryptophan synthase subunit alpha [Deltaproteobacteria bacterium]|nr:tryptophan synthase subunit alpha [Deltaproteobacteria bacterium]